MKKLFALIGFGACLLVTSCSNEISSEERIHNYDTKGLTSFYERYIFFSPALGSYASGRFLGFQDHGDYWTSTTSPFAVSPYGTQRPMA